MIDALHDAGCARSAQRLPRRSLGLGVKRRDQNAVAGLEGGKLLGGAFGHDPRDGRAPGRLAPMVGEGGSVGWR